MNGRSSSVSIRVRLLDKPLKKAFSAVDKSSDQMLMAILLEYSLRMGVDLRLVSAASSIPRGKRYGG
jgi:hypothetical protein